MQDLQTKIKNRSAVVAVIGMGYVGLPTAVILGKAGYHVIGIDASEDRVAQLKKGISFISDVSSENVEYLLRADLLDVTQSYDGIWKADIVLICVPTPVTPNKIPELSCIQSAVSSLLPFVHKDQLIVLESSTYPGTTREIVIEPLEKEGWKVGEQVFVAFCPERVDPGNKQFPFEKVARVVGGASLKDAAVAAEFYRSFLDADVLQVSSLEVAEMTKLLENTFRLVNISFINEFAMIGDKMGIDVWEVIEAAKTKPFGFTPFYPSAKVGGHCAPVDPFYLSWKAKEFNYFARFIELAGEINEQRPFYVIHRAMEALNEREKSMKGSRVLVWGVSYKKDIGDVRDSASLDIIPELQKLGAHVQYFDPFIPEVRIGSDVLVSQDDALDKIDEYDLVLLLTDHTQFDYQAVFKKASLVVDTRNVFKKPMPNVIRV